MGGINFYSYAPNPLTWIDPFGWSCWSAKNVGGRKVYQRNSLLFDVNTPLLQLNNLNMKALNSPSFKELKELIKSGATNKQIMEAGYALFGTDG